MRNIFLKRLCAYLIDFLIVYLLVILLSFIPFLNPTRASYNEKYNELVNLTNEYVEHKIDENEYKEAYIPVSRDIYKLNTSYVILDTVIVLLYFGLLPFFYNGQTIGKKLFNLKITSTNDKKLSLVNYFIRSLVLNNIIISLISLLVVYIFEGETYYQIYQNVNLVGYILMYVSLFMVIIRKDNRGLHDFVAGTKVVMQDVNKIAKEEEVLVYEKEVDTKKKK